MWIRQNTSATITFFMPDSADPWSGKTGITDINVMYHRTGDSGFTSLSGASVTEIGYGFYSVTLPPTVTANLGFVELIFTGTGAKTQQYIYQVVAFDPDDANALGLAHIAAIKSQTDQLQFTSNQVHATVQSYAAGQSPADLVLVTPANKLATNSSGYVTVGGYDTGQSPADLVLINPANKLATDATGAVTVGVNNDKTGYSLTTTQMDALVDAVWDEPRTGHTTADTFGYYLDTTVSSRMPSGSVTVGGYDAGQSPAEQILSTPANKLYTSSGGEVIAGSLTDGAIDSIWNRQRSAVSRPAGSFGDYLDAKVSSAGGSAATDWTDDEKKQIRYVLGLDGDQQAPTATTGYIPSIKSRTDQLNFTGGNVHASVQAYGSGLSPAELVLASPSNKLATDSNGYVTVVSNQDKSGYTLASASVTSIVNGVWDEPKATHNTPNTFGYFLDAQVSSRQAAGGVIVAGYDPGLSPAEQVLSTPANKLATASDGSVKVGDYSTGASPGEQVLSVPANKLVTDSSGRVTVGGYATGQSPAQLVLSNPANKLATDAFGRVTVGVNQDKSGYSLDSAERSSIASAVWNYVVEGTWSALKLLRLVASVLFGRREISGSTFRYYGMDSTTERVRGSVDADYNRNIDSLNGD